MSYVVTGYTATIVLIGAYAAWLWSRGRRADH